jgi:hypothetical protein
MNNATFYVKAFFHDFKDILLRPGYYFSNMDISGGMAEPLIKTVIYGAAAGIITYCLGLLNLGPVGGGIFGGAFGIRILIWEITGAVAGLFIGSVVLLLISSICKGNTGYKAIIRVVASVMVLLPVSAFLGFTVHINFYLGAITGIVVDLLALWLVFHGLTDALDSDPAITKIVTYVLIVLFVLAMILSLGKIGKASRMLDEFNKKEYSGLR